MDQTIRKIFSEPTFCIDRFEVSDIVTVSGEDDWGAGEFPISIIEKP